MYKTAIWMTCAVCCGAMTADGQGSLSDSALESAVAASGLRVDIEGQPDRFARLRAIENKFAPLANSPDKGTVAVPVGIDPELLERFKERDELPVIESFFENMLPETVCVPDERVQQLDTVGNPWSANCQLVITLSGTSQAIGTGWLMGPQLVVTAGHCVHDGAGGEFFESVEVIPGANGPLEPFGSKVSASARLRASDGWKTSGNATFDYGAILLDAPFTSSTGIAPANHPIIVKPDSELLNASVYVSGYPGDKLFGTQWRDSDPISTVFSERLRYRVDTFGGQSGSALIPVGESAAVGIHTNGGCPNSATRITAGVKADLDAWLAESLVP